MLSLLRFLRFLRFFLKIQKIVTFYVFCFASHVFSNYAGSCNEQTTHSMEKTKRMSPRNLAENCFPRYSIFQHLHPLGMAGNMCCRLSAVVWTNRHRVTATAYLNFSRSRPTPSREFFSQEPKSQLNSSLRRLWNSDKHTVTTWKLENITVW